jgi:hypothetical protein
MQIPSVSLSPIRGLEFQQALLLHLMKEEVAVYVLMVPPMFANSVFLES